MDKQIDMILRAMRKQAKNEDTEEAHRQADNILVSLVRLLAESSEHKDKITKIIDAYTKVGKWYV